ncbi:MAG: ACP S-malonyltransferase [Candidatus Cloacimonetes bacterium]|nr:ACP S-malonyltransferase [Candidatus Cloacimonadota bacterium]
MKIAFVFPGQGAQYVGMAQDYIDGDPIAKQTLLDFDAAHGTQLYSVMLQGPEEQLKQTSLTQPAILFHSICALRKFQEQYNIKPDFVAGHSLGEFSALVASGILRLEDAMHIVHKRGEYMTQAVGDIPFAMAAIIGLDAETVTAVCQEISEQALVQAVNYNTPVQTVISGTAEGVRMASELAIAKGAKRAIPLVVGGPFHTPLVEKASGWLINEMDRFSFLPGTIPVVSNLDAQPSLDGAVAREKLGQQIISPVRWVESVRFMIASGVTHFIEFGPQKVLSGMIKNIDKEVQVNSIDRIVDLALLEEVLH